MDNKQSTIDELVYSILDSYDRGNTVETKDETMVYFRNRLFRRGFLYHNVTDGQYKITDYGRKLLKTLRAKLFVEAVSKTKEETNERVG